MKDNETYLVCTNIRETWPENKKKSLIFSSEAALDRFPKKDFEYPNFQINNYHWKNKTHLLKDLKYLDNFYNKVLLSLSKSLNKIHNCNYSEKFWRVLLGPWLGTLIYILYDRWRNLETTKKNFKIDKLIKLKIDPSLFIPYEAEDFIKQTQNDLWNQFIYQSMFTEFFEKEKIEENHLPNYKLEVAKNTFRQNKDAHSFIKKISFKFFNFINKKKYKYLIFKTYIGAINELKLSFKFNQFPIFQIEKQNYISTKSIDRNLRLQLDNLIDTSNKFENFAVNSLKNLIPKVFLENFEDLKKFSSNSNLPKNPEKIISANALWYDSFFMYHSALLMEGKTKLIYAQHGGAYGISEYSWPEEHEKQISDKYLSWGWNENQKKSRVKKFFVILKKKNFEWNENKMTNLLILMRHRKVYFQSPETSAGTELFSDYMKFCNSFFNSLNDDIIKKIVLRFPYKNLKKDSVDFFSNLDQFNLDSKDSFETACNKSKLIINTANSTTFCETLTNNIPSILIINKENNPFRKDAFKALNELEENKLLFYSTKEASNFINKIWDRDIKNWWSDKKTQNALNIFRNNYARRSSNIIEDYYKEIINDY